MSLKSALPRRRRTAPVYRRVNATTPTITKRCTAKCVGWEKAIVENMIRWTFHCGMDITVFVRGSDNGQGKGRGRRCTPCRNGSSFTLLAPRPLEEESSASPSSLLYSINSCSKRLGKPIFDILCNVHPRITFVSVKLRIKLTASPR